jgi:hypothetical protein
MLPRLRKVEQIYRGIPIEEWIKQRISALIQNQKAENNTYEAATMAMERRTYESCSY